ncbi:hypothetical protein HDU82_002337, partial [Entophlyctis luteolus]
MATNTQLEHLQSRFGACLPALTRVLFLLSSVANSHHRPPPQSVRATQTPSNSASHSVLSVPLNPSPPHCSEWLQTQHRDTAATAIGHASLSAYYAVALNESVGRVRLHLVE